MERDKCIVCRKRNKREYSLFCECCFKKPFFVRLRYYQKSPEFSRGWNKKSKTSRPKRFWSLTNKERKFFNSLIESKTSFSETNK